MIGNPVTPLRPDLVRLHSRRRRNRSARLAPLVVIRRGWLLAVALLALVAQVALVALVEEVVPVLVVLEELVNQRAREVGGAGIGALVGGTIGVLDAGVGGFGGLRSVRFFNGVGRRGFVEGFVVGFHEIVIIREGVEVAQFIVVLAPAGI